MRTIRLFTFIKLSILMIFLYNCSEIKSEDFAESSDGVKISFEKKGNKYPPIIFIHGWTNQRTVWEDQIDYFSKNYTTIALDLAGSGKSDNNRKDWTINAFSNDVIAVMNKLKLEKVVIVGFSMGAMVAVETAVQVPERILGVISIDEIKNPSLVIPEEMIPNIVDHYFELVTTGLTNKNLVDEGFYLTNEEVNFKKVSRMYNNVSYIGWKESFENALKWMNSNQKSSLKQIKVPYIGIFSDRAPVEIDTLKAYIPYFKAETIPNTGHLVFWDSPKVFNEILEKEIKEIIK